MTITDLRTVLGTPNWMNETSGDFSALTATMAKRYVSVADHTRIVKGADDLVAGSSGGGVARSAPIVPDMSGHAIKTEDDDTLAPRDLRSERQIELMISLHMQLANLDDETCRKAVAYTVRMTEAGKWTAGRGGNASEWIGRMIAKVRELKANGVRVEDAIHADAVMTPAKVQHDEMPVKENKNGKPMPMYYAVEIDGVTKFYRVKAGTKPGWWWIEAQASDEFHPIRNVGTKNNILRAIINQGASECMRNYGRKINHCGRCHKTLTDATSRANGIGPECEGKM